MSDELVKNSLLKSQSHLSSYLEELSQSSKNQAVVVRSRWPSKGMVVTVYPKSVGDWLILFFKTLRFDISKQAHSQYLDHSINLLKIYKKAVQYELIASKPKWLAHEQHQLTKLDEWLQLLQTQMDSQPGFSPDQKDELYEWAGHLDDTPTVLSSSLLLQLLKKTPDEQKPIIQQFRESIQERKQQIPGLIEQAVKEAEDYINENRPAGTEKEVQEIGSVIDSLFNFFITEEGRSEMAAVTEQLENAASIWKKVSGSKEFQQKYQPLLQEIHRFFKETVEEQGAARDLTAGIAFAALFIDQKRPAR